MSQVKIHRLLEKSNKKKVDKDKKNEEESGTKEEEKLKKKVTNLMKQQKLRALRQVVNRQDVSKPWGHPIKAKVCNILVISGEIFIVILFICLSKSCSFPCTFQVGSRLIELLIQTAYIQPRAEKFGDDLPEIRPAFVHTFRTVMRHAK